MERRDSLGRRIGHNWWREFIMEAYDGARFSVEAHREDAHQMEPDEYAAEHPAPTLKSFLIASAGMARITP
jgi:hypothetical protein